MADSSLKIHRRPRKPESPDRKVAELARILDQADIESSWGESLWNEYQTLIKANPDRLVQGTMMFWEKISASSWITTNKAKPKKGNMMKEPWFVQARDTAYWALGQMVKNGTLTQRADLERPIFDNLTLNQRNQLLKELPESANTSERDQKRRRQMQPSQKEGRMVHHIPSTISNRKPKHFMVTRSMRVSKGVMKNDVDDDKRFDFLASCRSRNKKTEDNHDPNQSGVTRSLGVAEQVMKSDVEGNQMGGDVTMDGIESKNADPKNQSAKQDPSGVSTFSFNNIYFPLPISVGLTSTRFPSRTHRLLMSPQSAERRTKRLRLKMERPRRASTDGQIDEGLKGMINCGDGVGEAELGNQNWTAVGTGDAGMAFDLPRRLERLRVGDYYPKA